MEGDRLIAIRAVGDLSTACALVDSFKRDFPHGKVLVENPQTFEADVLVKGSQLIALFP